MIELKDDAWVQVSGDVDPGKYGGVFAQKDGTAIQLFSVEPVREHESNTGAAEIGYPFWKAEGYYDDQDLAYSEEAKTILGELAEALSAANWYEIPPEQRASLLFARGIGKESVAGGWARELLPEEPVFGMDGQEVLPSLVEEEDTFNQDILGKAAVYLCTYQEPGGDFANDPFMVRNQLEVLEWTREMVEEAAEDADEDPDFSLWRDDPFNVALADGCSVVCQLVHTFEGSIYHAVEAAELFVEAFNDGVERFFLEDLADEVRQMLEKAPEGYLSSE